MNISDYLNKRCLLKVGASSWGSSGVEEYRILEVSVSGNWVKLQNRHGNKLWHAVTEVSFVEELRDFRAERVALDSQ